MSPLERLRQIESECDEYLRECFEADTPEQVPIVNQFIRLETMSEAEHAIRYLALVANGNTNLL